MCVMSSRLITAPSCRALTNSSAGVSLEVNITASPLMPVASASRSSGSELQSAPNPSSMRIFMMKGFGHAFMAKKFWKAGFHAKARFRRRALARMPASSYRWNGVG